MNTIEKKHGVCEKCGCFIPIDVVEDNGKIYYYKACSTCGNYRTLISIDKDYYFSSKKDFLQAPKSQIKSLLKCPYNCGLCDMHKQKVCMAMVETTDDCNVHCDTCIAGSCPGGQQYITLEDFSSIIRILKRTQDTVDLLMLSGGEPTIHPLIIEMIDLCAEQNVKHVMIISNGLRIANDEQFVQELAKRRNYIEIYLQFDSLRDESIHQIRGKELNSSIRLNAISNLEKYKINYTLVCVVKKGVNEGELKEIISFAINKKFCRGVTIQPLKNIGRGNRFNKNRNYLTLTEARELVSKTGFIPIDEMIPHPCNSNCICIGYLDKQKKPITHYLFEDFENKEELKGLMYYLSYLDNDSIRYEDLFRITIVSFLDKYNFTIEDAQKCCISFVTADGRIVPFDTHYVYHS